MKYLRTYEDYYQDDLNVALTSTVEDIFADLTEDSDFHMNCFTVGYRTLKDAGATHTENDITFFLWREYQEHEIGDPMLPPTNYKSFKIDEVLPYIKRMVDFMESEGKPVGDISYQYRVRNKIKQVDVDSIDELTKVKDNIENIGMKFGTGHFSAPGLNEEVMFDSTTIEDILLDITDEGHTWNLNVGKSSEGDSSIAVYINTKNDGVNWDRIIPCILRLCEYLKKEGYSLGYNTEDIIDQMENNNFDPNEWIPGYDSSFDTDVSLELSFKKK